jgi:hypothetical protein
MVFPRSADFIFILLEQPKRRRDLTVAGAIIVREFHRWFQPGFGLPGGVLHMHMHMHMHPRLFARKKVKPVCANAKDRGAHA